MVKLPDDDIVLVFCFFTLYLLHDMSSSVKHMSERKPQQKSGQDLVVADEMRRQRLAVFCSSQWDPAAASGGRCARTNLAAAGSGRGLGLVDLASWETTGHRERCVDPIS